MSKSVAVVSVIVMMLIFVVPLQVSGVGSGEIEMCAPEDRYCEDSETMCQHCDSSSGSGTKCRKRSLSNPGEGQVDCRTVFVGTFGAYCELSGSFCAHITVTP